METNAGPFVAKTAGNLKEWNNKPYIHITIPLFTNGEKREINIKTKNWNMRFLKTQMTERLIVKPRLHLSSPLSFISHYWPYIFWHTHFHSYCTADLDILWTRTGPSAAPVQPVVLVALVVGWGIGSMEGGGAEHLHWRLGCDQQGQGSVKGRGQGVSGVGGLHNSPSHSFGPLRNWIVHPCYTSLVLNLNNCYWAWNHSCKSGQLLSDSPSVHTWFYNLGS